MNLTRINASCGLFSAVVFIALWITAAYFAPDWHLGELSLSNLGICGVPISEICFNMGCAYGGIFGVMFGIYIAMKKGLERALGILMIVACYGLAGIGIVNLGYGNAHYITAMTYASFSIICILLSIYIDIKNGDLDFAVLSIILLGICVVMQVISPFEVYEPTDVTCECIWIASQSAKYLRKEEAIHSEFLEWLKERAA